MWELQPRVIHWPSTVVVRSTFTNGAVVWWKRIKVSSAVKLLTTGQRQALLENTGAINKTGTACMDTIVALPSLQLFLKGHRGDPLEDLWHIIPHEKLLAMLLRL